MGRRTIKNIIEPDYEPTCFFTGMTCNRNRTSANKGKDILFSATLEHIIPYHLIKNKSRINEVVAINFMNTLVDDLPIRIKYEIKAVCATIDILPGMSNHKVIQTYKHIVKCVKDQYKNSQCGDLYPWDFLRAIKILQRKKGKTKQCMTGFTRQNQGMLKHLLMNILTEEEKVLYKDILTYRFKMSRVPKK